MLLSPSYLSPSYLIRSGQFLRKLAPTFMASDKKWVSFYSGPESSIDDICEQFSKFEGGKVELLKNEENRIATIKINHPERRNALSGSMMVQLHHVVNELENWKEGKGVILHSVGEMFCSGGDLNTVKQISNHDDGYRMSTLMHSTLTRLHQLPLVSVALVQGKALGGGAELATACDFRLFTANGEIGFVQGRMGVVTGWGGGSRLVQLLGQHRALELLLTSRQVPAHEALALGLANGITQSADTSAALRETESWLVEKLVHAPQIVHALKHIVATARAVPYEESLRNERKVFAMLWGGDVNKDALRQNIKHK